MTSIISNFDFENIEFALDSTLDSTTTDSIQNLTKDQFKSQFEEYKEQLLNGNCKKFNDNVKGMTPEQIESYKQLTLSNLDYRIELLNTAITTNDSIIHVIQGFDYPCMNMPYMPKNRDLRVTNEYWLLNNLIPYINSNTIQQYQFVESVDTECSRLFFDIDVKPKDFDDGKSFEISKIFQSIIDLLDELRKINSNIQMYSITEYSEDALNIDNPFDWNDYCRLTPNLVFNSSQNIVLKNSLPEFKEEKAISSHIYFNISATREIIVNFINRFIEKYQLDKSLFDASVFKTDKHQSLRLSYSAKVNSSSVRRVSNEMINDFNTYILPIVPELHCGKGKNDLDFSEQLNNMYPEFLVPKATKTSKNQHKSSHSSSQPNKKSIFSYLSRGNGRGKNIVSFKTLVVDEQKSAFEVAQLLMPYVSFVLSPEEFEEELYLLIPDIITQEWNASQNEEWIDEKLIPQINYKQDLTNIQPLYILKRNTYSYLETVNTMIVKQEKEDPSAIDTLNALDAKKDELSEILEKLDQYIDIYKYVSFASHTFYNIDDPKQIKQYTKNERVLYNIYKLDDGQYIEAFNRGAIYKSQTAFKNHFKYSGEALNYIESCITVFHSVSQFNFYRSQYLYLSSDKQQLLNDIHDLLKVLKMTFRYEEDFKYYIGFLALKIRKMTTLNKGIISQPANDTSGKDALKTFMTDLLSSFITIKKASIEQFNNRLNGEYLKSDLLIFEEMPKDPKDVDTLVNKIKENSSSFKVNAECKGVDSIEIDNNLDFIMNSNHTLSKLYKNKQDCEAMIKRFKVLTRVSLNMTDSFVKSTLDKFGWQHQSKDKRAAATYAFYIYLKESEEVNEYIDFYDNNKDTLNIIEDLYLNTSIDDNTTDKIVTGESIEKYTEYFKNSFVDKQGRISTTKLASSLMTIIPTYKTWKQATVVREIKVLNIFKLVKEGDKQRLKCENDDQIAAFYNHYFEFDANSILLI